jgi:hypothetical protein
MLMSCNQNGGKDCAIKIVVGTTVTKQNYIHKKCESRLNCGSACCHSVQNLLPPCLLSKNIKIEHIEHKFYLLFHMGLNLCLSH